MLSQQGQLQFLTDFVKFINKNLKEPEHILVDLLQQPTSCESNPKLFKFRVQYRL